MKAPKRRWNKAPSQASALGCCEAASPISFKGFCFSCSCEQNREPGNLTVFLLDYPPPLRRNLSYYPLTDKQTLVCTCPLRSSPMCESLTNFGAQDLFAPARPRGQPRSKPKGGCPLCVFNLCMKIQQRLSNVRMRRELCGLGDLCIADNPKC